MHYTQIQRDSDIFKKCVSFAKALADNSYYSDKRAASSTGDIARNHKNSKLSELLVSAYVSKQYGCKLMPDFEIYDEKHKSWDADLPYRDQNCAEFPYNVHVKSTDNVALNRVGQKSWVFQRSNKDGKGGTDAILKESSENDWVAFCYVDEQEKYANVFLEWFMPWKNIVTKDLLKDPVYKKFQGIKLCVYEDDLKKEFDDLRLS